MRRLAAVTVALGLTLAPFVDGGTQDTRRSPVGVPVEIRDLVLPGGALEVEPADLETPVIVRLAATYPHGTDHRYDVVYYGLDPGEYDLGDFLQRRDGTPVDDLPPLPIVITTMLPPGQVQPNRLEGGELPSVGGYRFIMWVIGIAWVAGLWTILAHGRKRRIDVAATERGPTTLAERLRPLVEDARAGKLSRGDRAELEMALIAYWRRRVGLEATTAAEALAALRGHAEAGPLLTALEEWLHRPDPPEDVDVGALLAPYRDLPADALESAPAS